MDESIIFAQVLRKPISDECKFNFEFATLSNDVINLDSDCAYNIYLKKAYIPSCFYNLNHCGITVEYEDKKHRFYLPSNLTVKSDATFTTQCKKIFESEEIAEIFDLDESPLSIKLHQSKFTLTCKNINIPYKIILSDDLISKLGFTSSNIEVSTDNVVLKTNTNLSSNPFAKQERILITSSLCKPSRYNSFYMPILQSVEYSVSSKRCTEYIFPDPMQIPTTDTFHISNFTISLLDESLRILKCDPCVMQSIMFVLIIRKIYLS